MNSAPNKTHWDAIIIGSGIGGLVLSGLLAKTGKKRVLLVERHSKLGGFTHGFLRKAKYHFDIGVHYIGELESDSDLRALFQYLTDGKLKWRPLPNEFERLVFDEFEWSISGSRNEHLEKLVQNFPEEKKAINEYFIEEKKISDAYGLWHYSEKFSKPVEKLIRLLLRWRHPNMFLKTVDYFDRQFSNQKLKKILQSRWMGFGIPPRDSSFGMHCLHSVHYSQGAWYPVNGGQSIADHIAPVISAAGGKIITKKAVEEILINEKTAYGIRMQDGEIAYSNLIISNIGARNTYLKLIPSNVPVPFRKDLEKSDPGASLISLFIGLNRSPRQMGFEAANYWLCPASQGEILKTAHFAGEPYWGFLSFPSLKMEAGHHTAQVIILSDDLKFKQWRNSRWRRRPEEYEQFKAFLTEKILTDLERRFPGFADIVDYTELSTPLSVEHFHGAPGGAVYGVPSTPERFFMPWATAKTPVKGLFLTGSDTFSPGISGAIHGALKTFELISESPHTR